MSRFGNGSFNGLAFGPQTRFHVKAITGLDDLPGLRTTDSPRPGDHGSYTGRDFAEPRTVALDLLLRGDNPEHLDQLVEQAKAVFQPTRDPLPLYLRDGRWLLWAKCRRRSIPYDAEALASSTEMALEFFCADPRVYGGAEQVLTATLPSGGGGHGFPHGFPLSFGGTAGSEGGTVYPVNPGNAEEWPLIVFVAGENPLEQPSVVNGLTGQGLYFNLTVQPGETLWVDTKAKTALLNGVSSRRTSLLGYAPRWPSLQPGVQTPLTFGAAAYSATAEMRVHTRGASL